MPSKFQNTKLRLGFGVAATSMLSGIVPLMAAAPAQADPGAPVTPQIHLSPKAQAFVDNAHAQGRTDCFLMWKMPNTKVYCLYPEGSGHGSYARQMLGPYAAAAEGAI